MSAAHSKDNESKQPLIQLQPLDVKKHQDPNLLPSDRQSTKINTNNNDKNNSNQLSWKVIILPLIYILFDAIKSLLTEGLNTIPKEQRGTT